MSKREDEGCRGIWTPPEPFGDCHLPVTAEVANDTPVPATFTLRLSAEPWDGTSPEEALREMEGSFLRTGTALNFEGFKCRIIPAEGEKARAWELLTKVLGGEIDESVFSSPPPNRVALALEVLRGDAGAALALADEIIQESRG